MPTLTIESRSGAPRTFTWVSGSIGIGRHPQNHVVLGDETVSRWHAAVFPHGPDGHRLRDLGSRQGVRILGRRVVDRGLEPGDVFEVGPFRLAFHPTSEAVAPPLVDVDEELSLPGTRPRQVPSDWRPRDGARDDAPSIHQLLRAIREVGSKLGMDEMLSELLQQVEFMAGPSECFVALVGDDGGLDVRARRSTRRTDASAPLPLSRTLLRRALETGQPLSVARIAPRSDLASASVRALGIVAVECVPLVSGGRVRAVLHADWRQDRPAPSDAVRQWIAALALHGATAFERCRLHSRLLHEKARLADARGLSAEMVGVSRPLRELVDLVDRCAAIDMDVLITGETGTGKELVARRIHDRSRRRLGPFVAINCAAIPAELFESELFGHVKGAFTHAVTSRDGRFAEAEGGTIFLDEIGEMSQSHQAKLLRVLEERRAAAVGGRPRDLDVRVVAATNRDLRRAGEEGVVRIDLCRRLGVPIAVPPLRERSDDVPMLSYWLLDRLGASFGRRVEHISADTMECLVAHAWPGNVRELSSCLRNALLFCDDTVRREHLRLTPEVVGDRDGALPTLAAVEKEHLMRVLGVTSGNQSRAAKVLGVNENTVKAMMTRHGLDRSDFAR